MKTNLKAIPGDSKPKLDDLSIAAIIGRDASQKTELIAPKFSDHSKKDVNFGGLKSILKTLNKL